MTLTEHAEHLADDIEATASELLRVRTAFLNVARRIETGHPASPEFTAAVEVVRRELSALRDATRAVQ